MKTALPASLAASLSIVGCATSNHGSFVASTHAERASAGGKSLGPVTGESKQTCVLYFFPNGEAPSTNEAIQNAKEKIPGTKYLTDMAIDDRMYWHIGYSEQVIKVDAQARR